MWYLFNKIIKRIFDFAASLVAVILLSPLFLLIAAAIKCDSKGPVLFAQQRRTENGRVFKMYKFRSMVVNAQGLGTGLFNFENDPRVTKVGRFLRDSSLDELPQLFNVIKGDISLVGPRPCVIDELGDFETLNRRYRARFAMPGGITGLAQVKGRNGFSWDEKVEHDNLYISLFKKQGVWLDFKILIETVVGVFKKQDVYEKKVDTSMSDEQAASFAQEEIIRIAHLPDEE